MDSEMEQRAKKEISPEQQEALVKRLTYSNKNKQHELETVRKSLAHEQKLNVKTKSKSTVFIEYTALTKFVESRK